MSSDPRWFGSCCCAYNTVFKLFSASPTDGIALGTTWCRDHGLPDKVYSGDYDPHPTYSFSNRIAIDSFNRVAASGPRVDGTPFEALTSKVAVRLYDGDGTLLESRDFGPDAILKYTDPYWVAGNSEGRSDPNRADEVRNNLYTYRRGMRWLDLSSRNSEISGHYLDWPVWGLCFDTQDRYIVCGKRYTHPLSGSESVRRFTRGISAGLSLDPYPLGFSYEVAVDPNNDHIYVCGTDGTTGNGTTAVVLKKYNESTGSLIWSYSVDNPTVTSDDVGRRAVSVATNTSAVFIYLPDPTSADSGTVAYSKIIKLDHNGNCIWEKLFYLASDFATSASLLPGKLSCTENYVYLVANRDQCAIGGASSVQATVTVSVPHYSTLFKVDASTGDVSWARTFYPSKLSSAVPISDDSYVWVGGQGHIVGNNYVEDIPFYNLGGTTVDASKENLWEIDSNGNVTRTYLLGKPTQFICDIAAFGADQLFIAMQRTSRLRPVRVNLKSHTAGCEVSASMVDFVNCSTITT